MTDEQRAWLRSEFERCSPYIQAALDRDIGTHELEDIWDCIVHPEGRTQFWPGRKSAVVTALESFPRKTILRYWLAGGDLEDLLSNQQPTIETWGRKAGAAAVVIGGRKGWLKALSGFETKALLMVKAL